MSGHDSACLTLAPVLPNPARPSWSGAIWIGEVWRDAVDSADQASVSSGRPAVCRLQNADGFSRARLLVRDRARENPSAFCSRHTAGRPELTLA